MGYLCRTLFLRKSLLTQTSRFSTTASKMELYKSYFQGKGHASLYKVYRNELSPGVVNEIVNFLKEKFDPKECYALDVGCGTGQATVPLSSSLKFITGIDPSPAQVDEAKKNITTDNVDYKVGDADALPCSDRSLHLVNASSAFHWFNIPAFFKEVDRVLLPGGALSVSIRGTLRVTGQEEENDKVYDEIKEYVWKILGESRTGEKAKRYKMIENKYIDVEWPYPFIRKEVVEEFDVTVEFMMGLIKTYSGVAKVLEEKPEEGKLLLNDAQERLLKMIRAKANGATESTVVKASIVSTLILCHKPDAV